MDNLLVKPSDDPTARPVAAEDIGGALFQYLKLVDPTVASRRLISRLVPLAVGPAVDAIDVYGRQRMASPAMVFSSRLAIDKCPDEWDEAITGAGTSTFTNGGVTLAVVSGTDSAIRQTFRRFALAPGAALTVMVSAILNGAAGQRSRFGLFDTTAGYYVDHDGTSPGLVTRAAGVPSRVPQLSWNVDTLNGLGPSGVTLDVTKIQTFVFELGAAGPGSVRFGVMLGGKFLLAHESFGENTATASLVDGRALPLRAELVSSGGAGTSRQFAVAIFETAAPGVGSQRGIDTGGTLINLPGAGTLYGLAGVKQGALPVELRRLVGCVTSTTRVRWSLLSNPTGAITYSAVPGARFQGYAGAGVTLTGGTLIASGFILGSVEFEITRPRLGFTLTDVADSLVLGVTPMGGASDVGVSLSWEEVGA